MSTQDSWNWKVPTAKGTKWEPYAYSCEEEFEGANVPPFINVYCMGRTDENPHEIYLVGAFESLGFPSPDGHILWLPLGRYTTGDRYRINFNSREQLLVGNPSGDPRTKVFQGNLEIETEQQLEQEWENEATKGPSPRGPIRFSTDFHCKICGLRASLNTNDSERYDAFATPLYEAGIREVSLKSFIRFAIQ